ELVVALVLPGDEEVHRVGELGVHPGGVGDETDPLAVEEGELVGVRQQPLDAELDRRARLVGRLGLRGRRRGRGLRRRRRGTDRAAHEGDGGGGAQHRAPLPETSYEHHVSFHGGWRGDRSLLTTPPRLVGGGSPHPPGVTVAQHTRPRQELPRSSREMSPTSTPRATAVVWAQSWIVPLRVSDWSCNVLRDG